LLCSYEGIFDCKLTNQKVIVGDARAMNIPTRNKLPIKFAGMDENSRKVFQRSNLNNGASIPLIGHLDSCGERRGDSLLGRRY
jgi:hypothetical protein